MDTTIITTVVGTAWLGVTGLALALAAVAVRGERDAHRVVPAPWRDVEGRGLDVTAALLEDMQGHDGQTGWHARRVSGLARRVGARLGMPGGALDDLEEAALLHDVGKLRVPRSILTKPLTLSPTEWETVRRHPEWGAELLADLDGLGRHAGVVRAHHERWGGGGYPRGAVGGDIPLGSRIIAACDAFDAMTAGRPYAPRCSAEDALAELRACAGDQFDPLVIDALTSVLGDAEGEITGVA